MLKKLPVLLLITGLATGLLAACRPPETSTPGVSTQTAIPPTPTHIPADQPAATPAPPAVPTTPADAAALCPTAGADQARYISRDNGLCFLYPAYFRPQPDSARPLEVIALLGPAENPGAMETIVATLLVAFNGPADGLDSPGYAERWKALYLPPDMQLPSQPVTVGGQAGQLVDNLPGYAWQRAAFVVANGFKYQLTLQPRPEDSPKLAEDMQRVWDTVTQTIVFFQPANVRRAIRPAEVCPAATADTKLWINETSGFCLLYPADYEFDPEFTDRIIGGPVLADTQDWGKVRTSITVAGYDQPLAAAEQALTPPTDQIDPASVQHTTIGGSPAIVYDFTGGPWRQRTASIVHGGSVYTMVGPWDAEQFPQGIAEAQRLWDTVTSSITFFDKWR